MLADYLGLDRQSDTTSSIPPKPVDLLQFLANLKGCPREGLAEYGAEVDGDRVVFPVFGPDKQQCSAFTIWPKAPKDDKRLKGMLAKGRPSGLFFPLTDGGATHFPVPGETWLIVEGCKDASALYGLGYLAAGMNGDSLPQKFVPLFPGVDVVILPDRTATAEEKARESAARLAGVAKSVRIATLPLPLDGDRGDDVRDALRQRDGETLVRQCIDNAKTWTPQETDDEVRRMTGAEMSAKRIQDHQKGPPPRVATGIEKLDMELGGGVPHGSLAVIGALSSHGKTALGMQVGHHNTKHAGKKVIFLSLEMSLDQLADRTLSYASSVPASQWYSRNEHLEHEVQKHFEGTADYVFVDGISTLVEVERELVRGFEAGIKIAIVDYCQFIDASSRDDTNSIMRRVSAKLKRLAKAHDAVIFGLAQLHRRVIDRKPLIPTMGDIEYGSKLSHDADQVIYGVWPFRIDPSLPRDEYRLFIEKNRFGTSKVVIDAKFNPERMCVTAEVEPDVPSFRQEEIKGWDDWNQQSEGGFYQEGF